ncbi:hypothetical protein [Pontibacter harenae]|nr:hypothetical protein [Pontibacter harenae]MCC9167643.1 hypothetical protein [Pontibacter harenae]
MKENIPEKQSPEKPPILGSWRNLYLLVLGNLAFLIILFYLITRIYE